VKEEQVILLGTLLMEEAETACLTTVDKDGYPKSRAMLNLRNPTRYPALKTFFAEYGGDLTVYFSTNTSSKKFQQLKENPKVSVYYCHPSTWRGLTLVGDMEIIYDPKIKHALWQPDWTMYYPGGPEDPDHTVLKLVPHSAAYYANLSVLNWEKK
jgi:general stress protein 26